MTCLFRCFRSESPDGFKSLISPRHKTTTAPQQQTELEEKEAQKHFVFELISKARSSVYLVSKSINSPCFAFKIFDPRDKASSYCYQNEIRFLNLDHPNIIKYLYTADSIYMPFGKDKRHLKENKVSCIVMEFAPYGTLVKFLRKYSGILNDKLIRTYFRQLINAIEYLHTHGVVHLDIKLQNLLIAEDCQLRLTDFDMSYLEGDNHISSKGTRNYRAPEIKRSQCNNIPAADIYSAGIVLFILKSRGALPYFEDEYYEGVDLFRLMQDDSKSFFDTHSQIQEVNESYFDRSFCELFLSMVSEAPEDRPSIAEIKKSKWYQESVFSPKDLKLLFGGDVD